MDKLRCFKIEISLGDQTLEDVRYFVSSAFKGKTVGVFVEEGKHYFYHYPKPDKRTGAISLVTREEALEVLKDYAIG